MPPEYLHKETYVCDQCPRVFITKNHLREHIKRVHSIEYNSMGRDYVDSIKCSSCDVAFSSGNIYIQHYQQVSTSFDFEDFTRKGLRANTDRFKYQMVQNHMISLPSNETFKRGTI